MENHSVRMHYMCFPGGVLSLCHFYRAQNLISGVKVSFDEIRFWYHLEVQSQKDRLVKAVLKELWSNFDTGKELKIFETCSFKTVPGAGCPLPRRDTNVMLFWTELRPCGIAQNKTVSKLV